MFYWCYSGDVKAPKDQTAPGSLDLMRLFINTVDLENAERREELSDPGVSSAWLQAHGLLDESDALDPDEHERIIQLREAFRMELLAHNGEGDPDDAWEALSFYADWAELGVRCRETPGAIELIAEGRGAQRVAGRLFALMYDAIRSDQWPRLKACRKDTCLWAFYDHSKNGSGAWCDMAVCGNRVKAQRRRKRAAS